MLAHIANSKKSKMQRCETLRLLKAKIEQYMIPRENRMLRSPWAFKSAHESSTESL